MAIIAKPEPDSDFNVFQCLDNGDWGIALPNCMEPPRTCPKCGGSVDFMGTRRFPQEKSEGHVFTYELESGERILDAVTDMKRATRVRIGSARKMGFTFD